MRLTILQARQNLKLPVRHINHTTQLKLAGLHHTSQPLLQLNSRMEVLQHQDNNPVRGNLELHNSLLTVQLLPHHHLQA
jgi:hypothetical protein